MNYLIFAAGFAILIVFVIDILYTTLVNRGAGFISKYVVSFVWDVLFQIAGKKGSHRLLNFSGLCITVSLIACWVLMLWISNSLLFISAPGSVVHASTEIPVSNIEKFYFTGYTFSTMGLGDMKPNGLHWQVFTAFLSFAGLISITLALSYIIPVLSADLHKRKLSISIASMGVSPHQIILNAWNGKDLHQLTDPLNQLNDEIAKHGQNHLTYPILHYYHSVTRSSCAPVNLVVLDELITILIEFVPEPIRTSNFHLYLLRRSMNSYLFTLRSAFIKSSNESPPAFSLNSLKEAGIPLIMHNDLSDICERLRERRQLLTSQLKNDGWNWDDVLHASDGLESN